MCDDFSLIDPTTPKDIQPGAKGASNPGKFVLEYSDEFEGEYLNSNKWYSVDKGQSGRTDRSGNEFYWKRDHSYVHDGYLVQKVDKERYKLYISLVGTVNS